MKIKRSNGEKIFDILNIIIMLVIIVLTLYPMLYIVFAAVSQPTKFMTHEGLLFGPLGFTLVSFKAVFKNPNILTGYANTIFIVTVGVSLNILLTILGAYFLSRKGVLLKKPIMLMIIFTMYFHGGLIPFYLTVRGLHLDNRLWALIVPTVINTFNLIIMRTAFMAIPDSLEESAKIDGANHFTILFRIMLPLAMPTIAVIILYYGVHHWNSWFHAMIFLRKREMFPLQLVLREVIIQNDTAKMTGGAGYDDREMLSETIKYAVIVVATAPVLMLYPFLQKYFVKGVMVGALKG
jgi:putative aldouronate transport system permease protein